MPRSFRVALLLLSTAAVQTLGCGDDAAGNSADGAGGATNTGGVTNSGGSATGGTNQGGATNAGGNANAGGSSSLRPGNGSPAAAGWQEAFSSAPARIGCDTALAELRSSGAATLKIGAAELFVGYEQIGDNQNPILRRFDADQPTYCVKHEEEPPDGRAYGLSWDGGETAYLVFTIVGGGSAFDSAAKGGWVSRYGDGGGSSKVTVLGRVSAADGTLTAATFVLARREKGTKTNTLAPAWAPIVRGDGTVEVHGNSAFSPLNPDQSPMCVGTDYPAGPTGADGEPSVLMRFTPTLNQAVCAQTWGCSVIAVPCP